jgi:hypothetical protein
MHTVPGGLSRAARVHLRTAQGHISRVFEVFHYRHWPELDAPPGTTVPKPVLALVRALPAAVQAMYAAPPSPTPHRAQPGPGQIPVGAQPPGHALPPVRPREYPPRAGPFPPTGGPPNAGPQQFSAPQPGGLLRVIGGAMGDTRNVQ